MIDCPPGMWPRWDTLLSSRPPGDYGATTEQSLSSRGRSTFAVDGKDCTVNKEVERVLKEFHGARKPIG